MAVVPGDDNQRGASGLQLFDGNASDRATLAQQVAELVYQFRAEREEEPIYVAASAFYTEATMTALEQKGVPR